MLARFFLVVSIAWGVASAERIPSDVVKREPDYIPSPSECKKFDICDLKRVIFRKAEVYSPPIEEVVGEEVYQTTVYAGYVTESIGAIPKYLFVQFVRGCQFVSRKFPDGEVWTGFNILRKHMDAPEGLVPFLHTEWTIDSVDSDPALSSNQPESSDRHYFLQWTQKPEIWNHDLSQGNLYGEIKPKVPHVFVTDFPTPALRDVDGWVWNSSLEFRTCLYKASDVPSRTKSDNVDFATPIVCYAWSQQYVYNHQSLAWERPTAIVEECKRPLREEELRVFEEIRYYRAPKTAE